MEKCDKCKGNRHFIAPDGNFSRARLCECVEECGKCGGDGFTVERREGGYKYRFDCPECSGVRKGVSRYNGAKIPAVMANAELATEGNNLTPGSLNSLNYIRSFVDLFPEKKGFVLSGSPGRGTTSMVSWAIAELTLKNSVNCLFQDFGDLILRVQSRENGVSEFEILKPLFDCRVLVLDGVGTGCRPTTDWEKTVFEKIVSSRYSTQSPTILTTKHGSMDLQNEIGDHGFSRVSAMCEFLTLD